MSDSIVPQKPSRLLEPVYSGYLADPFAWRVGDTYYMVGTGLPEGQLENRRYFPGLVSHDFVHWDYCGHLLNPPDFDVGDNYWAPEVASHDGKFYMYYALGKKGSGYTLRVAVADTPLGPYKDSGDPLTDFERLPFAIDAHPFRDNDGVWYLFYARDFMDMENGFRAGTALVADRLVDMLHLAGEERVILRARHDWQRFMADRPMYGQIFDWHTLEGASVVLKDGKYVCFYSGGRWDSDLYGVDYATADHILGPYVDDSVSASARITFTVPDRIIGPGHNSVVVGPDGVTTYLVYHAWNEARTIRSPYISRLDWDGATPRPVDFG